MINTSSLLWKRNKMFSSLKSANTSATETSIDVIDSKREDSGDHRNDELKFNVNNLNEVLLQCLDFITKYGTSREFNSEDVHDEYQNLDSLLNAQIQVVCSENQTILEVDNFVVELPDISLNHSPSSLAHMIIESSYPLEVVLRQICFVCHNYENKRRFGNSGGCRELASLLKSTLSCDLVELLCLTIVVVCQDYNFNKIEYGKAGGCEGLFGIIKCHKEYKSKVLENVCIAISKVSSNCNMNEEKFRKLGISTG